MALDREAIKRQFREEAAKRKGEATPESTPTPTTTPKTTPKPKHVPKSEPINTEEAFDAEDIFNEVFSEDEAASFEEETPPTRESYTTEKGSSAPIFTNMRPTQKRNAYSITPKACVIPPASNFFTKHKRNLCETHTGISYMYKESFNYLLDCGIKHLEANNSILSARDIKNVALEDGIIKLHAFEIDPSNVLDPLLGNTLYDLIDFKTLFKKFPLLQHLRLDTEATEVLILRYGDDPNELFNTIFLKECKNLQVLEMIVGNKSRKITRKNFNADEAKNTLGESRMRSEIDQVSTALNPKKDRLTKAEKHRISERDKSMKKFNWGPAKEIGIKTAKKLAPVVTYALFGLTILTGHFILAGMLGALGQSIHEWRMENKSK